MRRFSKPKTRRRTLEPLQSRKRLGLGIEQLESRLLLTVVLNYHNDLASDGQNLNENNLTPANIKVGGSFGKIWSTSLDGQVYTQPLVDTGVTIVNGPNTKAGAAGLHDVVFVATEHDTLYALDASNNGTGGILWSHSFLNPSDPNDVLPGATAVTSFPNEFDVDPEVGVTGTPVIDPANNLIYIEVKTQETVAGVVHTVQRLHVLHIGDGTEAATPYAIGDTTTTTNGTTTSFTNNTQIYTYGIGDGTDAVTDPYNGTGKSVVEFNAFSEFDRSAVSLVNNTVYVEWASHNDSPPYHGWLVAWDVSHISTTGFQLKGVFNDSPNRGQAGIWMGGGAPTFEADGSALYFETGNGPGGLKPITTNSAGFPTTGDYPDALVKLVADPTTTPSNQNINGWGFTVKDYFMPYNQKSLDSTDSDFGSGAPIILPDSAGIPGHPHLMVAGGKQGKIYLIDRDNMGKLDPNNDNVVNAVPDGTGHTTPPVLVGGVLDTPAYYNGKIYYVSGYSSTADEFTINTNGTLSLVTQTAATFGYLPGSPSISAAGSTNGIVWFTDRNNNELHAYDANSLATELWNSGQKAGGGDALGAVIKFSNPTIANGVVYVGTYAGLVAYGLQPPSNSVPTAPALHATALSSSSINLTWTDATVKPNTASGYKIEESTDNKTFTQVTTAPAASTTLPIGGLSPLTTYYFRIRGFNGIGNSSYSNVVTIATTNQAAILDFSQGFATSKPALTYNGTAAINGTKLELTTNLPQEVASVFSSSAVGISKFNSVFTFQLSGGAKTSDGFTFAIQGVGPTVVGSGGGGLGSSGLKKGAAIKFDLYNNGGEGVDSTGLFTNGASPSNVGSIDLTPSGVDLHSGDVFVDNMTYNGTTLVNTITDTTTGATATQTYTVNLASLVGSSNGYVGFTGATGGQFATQDILSWTFSPPSNGAPAAPSGLGGQAASATSIILSWNNLATNQTGFQLDRADDSGFTQNLTTTNLPATPNTYTDSSPGLAPGQTYYYRIRATNTSGPSGNSNIAPVSIPVAPAKPTNAEVTAVTTGEIDISWTDNAGRTATGYLIQRRANNGPLTDYMMLPAQNAVPPTEYDWTDTGVSPGTAYEYHIVAINIAGNNDFTGTNASTLTLAPSGLAVNASSNSVNLSWTAPTGAVSYNIYRGGASGSETLLQNVPAPPTGTAVSFSDTTATSGSTYFYYVTALNANAAPLTSESAKSNEVSTTPTTTTFTENFSSGFAGSTSSLTYNGSAKINGTKLELTDGGKLEAGSVYTTTPINIAKFSTQFTFQTTAGTTTGHGFTFTIQNAGVNALGASGDGLGSSGIGKSVSVKFDLVDSHGEGPDSTGLFTRGAAPSNVGSIDLTPSGVNLHSGDVFQVTMTYDGTTLTSTILDTTTGKSATQTYIANIPQLIGASTGFVGFTGATGAKFASQDILTWTFTSNPPPPAAASLALKMAVATTPQTMVTLQRATNALFTQGLTTISQSAVASSYSDNSGSCVAGVTYFYRLKTTTSNGSTVYSNVISTKV